jgi:hypothetical protein
MVIGHAEDLRSRSINRESIVLTHAEAQLVTGVISAAFASSALPSKPSVSIDATWPAGLPLSNSQTSIVLTRDITFADADVLAKQAEEQLLFRDMQSDMVQQIMRRLAAAQKPKPPQ